MRCQDSGNAPKSAKALEFQLVITLAFDTADGRIFQALSRNNNPAIDAMAAVKVGVFLGCLHGGVVPLLGGFSPAVFKKTRLINRVGGHVVVG